MLATLPRYGVLLRDQDGSPVAGVVVSWFTKDGSLSSATSTTDDDGVAQVSYTLGPGADEQSVHAQVPGLIGSPVRFTAHARPGRATRLRADVGDVGTDRLGEMGGTITHHVDATDDHGNSVPGATVEWAVTTGGGSIVSSSSTTPAMAVHRLGRDEGTHSVMATAPDLTGAPHVTFTTTAVASVVHVQWDGWFGIGFQSPVTVVTAGKTVGWLWQPCYWYCYGYSGEHNVTFEDDPAKPVSSPTMDAGMLPAPRHFRTITVPGTYRYRCTNHSTSFSAGMVGTVIVQDAAAPSDHSGTHR